MSGPDSKETLSEADKYALSRMPKGWFSVDDLPPIIRCPRFRCERLTDRGMLEWRVVGEYPHFESRWRKKEQQSGGVVTSNRRI